MQQSLSRAVGCGRQMVQTEDGREEAQAQYWAYTPIDALKNGEMTLEWLKRPTVLDPAVLGKQKIPKKDKSALVLRVRSTEPEEKGSAKAKDKARKAKRSAAPEHSGLEQAVSYLISLLQNSIPDPDQV
eukprot:533956-Rhodomonas_salina.3